MLGWFKRGLDAAQHLWLFLTLTVGFVGLLVWVLLMYWASPGFFPGWKPSVCADAVDVCNHTPRAFGVSSTYFVV